MSFHRVVRGFVVQGGMLDTRPRPCRRRCMKYVRLLQPEFNDIPHVKGTLSMARADDPGERVHVLLHLHRDGRHARREVHGLRSRACDGMAAVEALDAVHTFGEMPRERVEIVKARVVRSGQ